MSKAFTKIKLFLFKIKLNAKFRLSEEYYRFEFKYVLLTFKYLDV